MLEKALASEKNEAVRDALLIAQANLELKSADPANRRHAVELLGATSNAAFRPTLAALTQEQGGVYAESDSGPGQRAAAGCAGAGHHLRPDGRHQYGARRTADDRRLCDVCGADAVPRLAAGLAGLVCGGGAAAGLRRDRAGRHGAGTHP
ncbi:hypothetical protein G6F57_018700 [Rhizopus arrhizus]|nr:hypothetical protein G6F57_018700 [Rhizopus arrhizus]